MKARDLIPLFYVIAAMPWFFAGTGDEAIFFVGLASISMMSLMDELWRPNTLVRVEDEWLGISRDLLIVSCTYKLSDNGTLTDLQLAPKQAYELQPEVTAAAGAGYAVERPAEKAPQPFKRSTPWI